MRLPAVLALGLLFCAAAADARQTSGPALSLSAGYESGHELIATDVYAGGGVTVLAGLRWQSDAWPLSWSVETGYKRHPANRAGDLASAIPLRLLAVYRWRPWLELAAGPVGDLSPRLRVQGGATLRLDHAPGVRAQASLRWRRYALVLGGTLMAWNSDVIGRYGADSVGLALAVHFRD